MPLILIQTTRVDIDMRHLTLCIIAAGLALAVSPASTDTLLLDTVDQARAVADMRPLRGLSMQSVEARFGPPTTRRAAVGTPPITRWDYPEFIVYFEHRHVIHAVRKRN